MSPDIVNGLFEALGSLFILNHCRVLFRHKQVRGVSVLSTAFFFSWGAWNLFYYPHLEQIWSFAGGALLASANLLYVAMLLHYRRRSAVETTYGTEPPRGRDEQLIRTILGWQPICNGSGAANPPPRMP